MKFNPNDIKNDFVVKKSLFRAKMCDICAAKFRGSKWDEDSKYNKKDKICVIPFIKNHKWVKEKCHNIDCKNTITHGVYGLKMEMFCEDAEHRNYFI